MTNLDSILKSGNITLPTKVCLIKAMVFPVVMYECESWSIKKAKHCRIDAFELWCWRRLLTVLWTTRRSNQSILKEISPEYSLEGLMLKLQYLATWCKELTHLKRPWCWERLMTEDEMVGWHHQLDGHELEEALGVGDGQENLACCTLWGCKELAQLNNWIELNWMTKITGWCDPLHRVQHSWVQS